MNDLYRLDVAAQQDREEFHFAFIGADFVYPHKTEIDAYYMQHLLQYSYRLAAHGHALRRQLPNMSQLLEEFIAVVPRTAAARPESSRLLSLPYEDIAAATNGLSSTVPRSTSIPTCSAMHRVCRALSSWRSLNED